MPFLDLGTAPPSNAYISAGALDAPERWYPLKVFACVHCWLVQTKDFIDREILFSPDYAYSSSVSSTWQKHCATFVNDAIGRHKLDRSSCVAEIAANDGCLLQYVKARDIPCYGVEPTQRTAALARSKGLEIIEDFFGHALAERLAQQGRQVDLLIANNVLAHVPDLNDFVAGIACLLKPSGRASIEFPHLLELVNGNQFDTIYHEHYSYFSYIAAEQLLRRHGLAVTDVELLPTHGGSLRLWARHATVSNPSNPPARTNIERTEIEAGLLTPAFYAAFQAKADRVKDAFLQFLIEKKSRGERVVGYGAAAKANTLLNYAGVRPDLMPYIVDRNLAKQSQFTPGGRIPIVAEDQLKIDRPKWIVVFPHNLKHEIATQLSYVREWGARIVIAVPALAEI